jgi:hypothetical protein
MKNARYDAFKRQRKTWTMNPVERVKDSAKKYDRSSAKQELKSVIEEEVKDLDPEDEYEYYGVGADIMDDSPFFDQ